MVAQTGLDEPKVDETAVDEITVDEPGPHLLCRNLEIVLLAELTTKIKSQNSAFSTRSRWVILSISAL